MIAMLEKQQCTRRISRYPPSKKAFHWGSKPGSVTGVTNDAGFISTPNGTVIVSVFCENLPNQHIGERVIGDISRAAMKATGIVEPLYASYESANAWMQYGGVLRTTAWTLECPYDKRVKGGQIYCR